MRPNFFLIALFLGILYLAASGRLAGVMRAATGQ